MINWKTVAFNDCSHCDYRSRLLKLNGVLYCLQCLLKRRLLAGSTRSNTSSVRCSVSSPDETTRSGVLFNGLLSVSSGDDTLCRMLDFTSQTK